MDWDDIRMVLILSPGGISLMFTYEELKDNLNELQSRIDTLRRYL